MVDLRGVKFNFAWALVYNVVLLPIAAGVDLSSAWTPKTGPCVGEFGHGNEFSERHLLEFGNEDGHPGRWGL